ncbi:MAG: ATP-binding protein [Dehalococcoidales bacterium]|nr:ATP-binding protein [Dehalococcoidales bacterium]
MKSINIQTRLTLWYLLVIFALLVFLSFSMYFILSRSYNQNFTLHTQLYKAQVISTDEVINVIGLDKIDFINYSSQSPLFSMGLKLDDRIIKTSDFTITTPTGLLTLKIDAAVFRSIPKSVDVYMYVVPSTVNTAGGYEFLVSTQETATQILSDFKRSMIIAGLATLVLAGLLGYFLTRKVLKPIHDITQTANDIGEVNLNRRIDVLNDDELGKLASTLNRMFERLEGAFNREKRFTADASHELRTPLAIIHGESTLALKKPRNQTEYRRALEVIAKETAHMSSVVDRLLFLARDTSMQQLCLENLDLQTLLIELSQDADVLAENKNIKITLSALPTPRINGDRVLIKELFLNLLDNAIRFTPAGGEVKISLDTVGHFVRVQIQDTGIGIPPDEITNIFKRFYRVNKAHPREESGVGLGLAICERIIELHKGKITVESEEGKGSLFSIYFPMME